MDNQTNYKKYFRIGEIPENERSINWLSFTFDDNETIYDLIRENPKEAYERLWEENLESGVSVYEINNAGYPIINNLQGLQTLSELLKDNGNIYNVEGQQVGVGNDGEPTVKNIKNIKKSKLTTKELHAYIYEKLKEVYKNMEGEYRFDKSSVYVSYDKTVTFGGVDFSNAKEGFDDRLGLKNGNVVRIKKYKFESVEIPLSQYLEENHVEVTEFVSKTGKSMVRFKDIERDVDITYTESQFNNKKVRIENLVLE